MHRHGESDAAASHSSRPSTKRPLSGSTTSSAGPVLPIAVAPRVRPATAAAKAAKATSRQRNYPRSTISASQGGRALLERASVQHRTLTDYADRIRRFGSMAGAPPLATVEPEALDAYLVDHFDALFFEGEGVDAGSRLLAAIAFHHPRFSRLGAHSLPRAWRALRGWKRLAPPKAGLPMPQVGMHAVVGALIAMNDRPAALATLLGFYGYLRPGELCSLTPMHLVAPVQSAPVQLRHWGLILGPVELRRSTKVGEFDESVLMDVPELKWIHPYMSELAPRQPPTKPVWPFDCADYCRRFLKASRLAGTRCLGLYPYSLRHGGASFDALQGRRPLAQIKKQGRWKADSSVRRYEKATRALQRVHRLPPATVKFGTQVSKCLPSLFSGAVRITPPS